MRKFLVRLVLAAIVAGVAVVWTIVDDKPSLQRARNMLANGIVARADVASALIEKTGSSTKSLILRISFRTKKGEAITASRHAPTEMLETLQNPKNSSELRPAAAADVVYFPDAPKAFDFKAVLENKVDPGSRIPVLAVFGVVPGLVVFFALGFIPALRLRKRKSSDPAAATVSPPAA